MSRGRGGLSAAIGIGIGLYAVTSGHLAGILPASAAGSPAPVAVIRFARAQIGCQYVWGGTGPCGSGFDCSGLAKQAYAAAGITIPRVSWDQWNGTGTQYPPTATPGRGWLVFFAGADGTPAKPGHVAIVLNPAKRTMLEAYAAGFPVRISVYGPGGAPGDTAPIGFTDPAQGG